MSQRHLEIWQFTELTILTSNVKSFTVIPLYIVMEVVLTVTFVFLSVKITNMFYSAQLCGYYMCMFV